MPGLSMAIDSSLSIPKFMARRHLIEHQEHDRIESSMDRHGIHVHRGSAKLLDPNTVHVECADGRVKTISSEFILIATGSSPVRPDHVPFNGINVVDADGVLQLRRIPKSMIIVGGGVIGCEYASIFAEIGVQVTLANPKEAVMPFLDAQCREHLVASMREAGVNFRLGFSVESVKSPSQNKVTVELSGGELLHAETLLWAAGRSSNTSGLGLEQAGVSVGERGVLKVDDAYRTNVPSVYAAGDVIGFPALASTSMEQGRIAVCRMFGMNFKHELAKVMPLGIYTIPAVSMVGMTEDEARSAKRDIVVGTSSYQHNARGRMLGDDQGMIKCVFDRTTQQLLGASIVGEGATEIIHIAQLAIVQNLGIDYFISTCFNYPSLSELFKYAAYSALQHMNASESTRRFRKAA
jgi:NAD(P) transhydrogenase